MCIGLPMRVLTAEGSFAWCEADGQRERLDMMLVGEQLPGTWVLAFHGAARQVMTEQDAARATAARRALAAVLGGGAGIGAGVGTSLDTTIDELFADLVGREPALPAHLRLEPVLPAHPRKASA